MQEQKAARAKEEEVMDKVKRGELDWDEMTKGMDIKTVPLWARAKKYSRPESNHFIVSSWLSCFSSEL